MSDGEGRCPAARCGWAERNADRATAPGSKCARADGTISARRVVGRRRPFADRNAANCQSARLRILERDRFRRTCNPCRLIAKRDRRGTQGRLGENGRSPSEKQTQKN